MDGYLTVLHNEKSDKETIREALTDAITHFRTLEPEQTERRIRALHYFIMLIANRRPSDEHDELIGLVNQQSGEDEVEIMVKSMADVLDGKRH